jgi:hypothetical protein
MKGYIVGSAAALVTSVAIVIIVMGTPGEAEGSINYIDGPWTLNETTTLSDGTWQVNGSVTVDGCTLTLQNATLVLGMRSSRSATTGGSLPGGAPWWASRARGPTGT